jgi:hypothetical protein
VLRATLLSLLLLLLLGFYAHLMPALYVRRCSCVASGAAASTS